MASSTTVSNTVDSAAKNVTRLFLYELYSHGQKDLKDEINRIVLHYGCPLLQNPLYNIIREIVTNSMKAIYKKIFYDTVIKNLGMGEVDYKDWLHLFKVEIETHKANNLVIQAKKRKWGIEVLFERGEKILLVDVINPDIRRKLNKSGFRNLLILQRI